MASSRPPTSSQVSVGWEIITSLKAEGSMLFNAEVKFSISILIELKISKGIGLSKSIFGRISLIDSIAASLANASISAPTKP